MAAINLNKPIVPNAITQDETGTPTLCYCCSRRAVGIGINRTGKGDPAYVCGECILIIEELRKVRRFDLYEIAALEGGVDAVGEWIEQRGIGTHLEHYDELDQKMLVRAAVTGFQDRLRRVIRDGVAPF